MFLLPVIWITAGSPDLREALADLPTTRKHLLALYGACAMLPAVLIQLRFSENPQAAWIYAAMPIRSPGPILVGATKAMMVRFVLPTFIMVAAITLAEWGFSILDDVALAGSAALLMCAVEGLLIGRCFPFSQGFAVSDASGRMSRSLLLLLIPAGLGGVHYILTFFPLLVPLAAPLVLALALLLFWVYARTPWSAVDMG